MTDPTYSQLLDLMEGARDLADKITATEALLADLAGEIRRTR